ncbi:hypothetical protein AYO41_00695 [Verrucomicrobia bacterium SCGC AG-212-E04]|nr:hypothetical protein AYO41_00695 [Verrucomicrobia bacterium SCGC AG-212-E04]
MKIIQTIVFDDQKRRIVVLQRDDDSFGFEEQHLSVDHLGQAWIPVGDHSTIRFDTAERALIEARRFVPWLAEARIGDAPGSPGSMHTP